MYPASSNVIVMPWFKKSKRRHKISKKDISEPTEFKHCYHAVLDVNSKELEGLPPQWSELVESQQQQHQPSSGDMIYTNVLGARKQHRPDTPHQCILEKDGPVKDSDIFTPANLEDKSCNNNNLNSKNAMPSSANTTTTTATISNSGRASSPKDHNAKNLCSTSKQSLSSTNSTLSLTKRPSPIVRDSDVSMEDTIRCIRKQSQHKSDESFQVDVLNRSMTAGTVDRDGMGRPRSGRSRTGSFMQLRSSPIVRKHVVSYTSGTTSVTPHPSDRLPPSNFCLSAPSEVIQSDLGLYDGSSELESEFYQCRINSPNGSSGYFGSSGSSLCSSRMLSTHQLSSGSQHSQPHVPSQNMPALPSSPRESDHQRQEVAAGNTGVAVPHGSGSHTPHPPPPSSSSSGHHGHHNRYSLQRRLELTNSSVGTGPAYHHYQLYSNSNSQGSSSSSLSSGGLVRSGYGTAPRPHRAHHHGGQCGGMQYPEMGRIHESGITNSDQNTKLILEKKSFAPNYPFITSTMLRNGDANVAPLSPGDSTHWHPGGRREVRGHHRSSSAGNYDHFRATLELLVSPGDPRGKYTDFRKIGEGSTGIVYTARDVATGETVAVKKMNLWKQQRRELLFNEVN